MSPSPSPRHDLEASGRDPAGAVAADRRRHHRVDVEVPGTLIGNALAGLPGFSTRTLNLSESGVKLHVPEELPMWMEVGLVLHLGEAGRHTLRARVLRSSPQPEEPGEPAPWAALEFVDVAPETHEALCRLVRAADDVEGDEDV